MPANVFRIFGLSYEILIEYNKRISCREYCSKSRVLISLQRIYATDLIRPDNGVETCPDEVLAIEDGVNGVMNQVAMNTNAADLRDFAKRSRKAASLIMQTVSDNVGIRVSVL